MAFHVHCSTLDWRRIMQLFLLRKPIFINIYWMCSKPHSPLKALNFLFTPNEASPVFTQQLLLPGIASWFSIIFWFVKFGYTGSIHNALNLPTLMYIGIWLGAEYQKIVCSMCSCCFSDVFSIFLKFVTCGFST